MEVEGIRRTAPWGRIAVAVVVLVAIALLWFSLDRARRYPSTNNATIDAEVVHVAAGVGGQIVQLPVSENAHVRKGDLLFQIDPVPYQAAVAQAEADLAIARASLGTKGRAVSSQRSAATVAADQVRRAEENRALAQRTVDRLRPLAAQNYIPRQQLDQAEVALRDAITSVAQAKEQQAGTRNAIDNTDDAVAGVQAREAALQLARHSLEQATVRAPQTGRIVGLSVLTGAELMLPDRPPLGVDSRGQARFDINQQQVSLLESVVTLRANQSELQWRAKGHVDLASAAAELHVGLTPVNLAQWLTQWQVQLPPMAAADALNHVGGSVKMRGEGSQWRFDELSLALDNAHWVGHGALSESGELALVINADQLNLDRYLPMDAPASKPQSQAQTANSAGAREPAKTDSKKRAQSQRVVPALSAQTLDFEPIRDLRASLSLGVSQFTAKQLTFDDLVLKATVDRGLINVKRLKTGLDDGDIDLSARLDARTDNAKLKLDTQVTDLELKPLLTTLMDESRLSGAAAMTLVLVSEGNSLRAWQQQLRGKVELNTQALTLNDIDIERSACELAATINRKPVPNIDWKQRTEFQQLQAQLQLQAGERLQIESITAQVENIRVKARGRLALNNGKFDVPMDAAFVGEADPERDCQVRDRWRNRDLPLRCKGQLASVSARSCGADKDRLEALITDEVKAEASDKLKSKLQEKLGDENAEAVDQLLRGLFKRK